MPADDSPLRHFGCPAEPGDPRILDAITVPEAAMVAARLAERHRHASSEGLTELLEGWSASAVGTAGFDDVWDLSFGHARRCLSRSGTSPGAVYDAAARVALRLTEIGQPANWCTSGPAIPGLRLGGHVLPPVTAIEAKGGQDARVVFDLADGDRIVAARNTTPTGCVTWAVSGGIALPCFGAAMVLPASALDSLDQPGAAFDGVDLVPAVEDGMVAALHAGAQALSDHAPGMAGWVRQVLRGVAPCRPEAAFRAVSGSNEHLPGIIHASHPLGRFDLAEILLHEAAHQYFYLLERLGPLDDGSDGQLYWSPPIRKARPLSRILMAFHALANVRLFYERCRGTGAEAEAYLSRNLASMDEAVAALGSPLHGNPALTGLGRAVYDPLHARLSTLA